MSRRQFRRRRWEQETNIRPAVRARRERYSGTDVEKAFGLGYDIGQADERKLSRQRDDLMLRLADASQAASDGDPGPMDELRREMGWLDDDLLDVADAAGATPLVEVDGDQLAAEFERWMRGQGGGE